MSPKDMHCEAPRYLGCCLRVYIYVCFMDDCVSFKGMPRLKVSQIKPTCVFGKPLNVHSMLDYFYNRSRSTSQ